MKKGVKLLLIVLLLRYGGDFIKEQNLSLPSRNELEAYAVQLGDSIADLLESLGFQPPDKNT